MRLKRFSMCGRFTLTASPERVAELLALAGIEAFPPRYNMAPTQPILVALGDGDDRPGANLPNRRAVLARWGLIPAWVKDVKAFPLLFNARAETAATKNAFRGALRYRRCLVPASGFYEWKRDASSKGRTGAKPYFLQPKDEQPFAFAGLMETYLSPDGSEIDTAAILTRGSTGAIAAIHERMPVVVHSRDHARWLNCRHHDPAGVADILQAANENFFTAVRVSEKVNKVANTSPEVQKPVEGEDETDAAGNGAVACSVADNRGKDGDADGAQLKLI